MCRTSPTSALFPYTTLFRSISVDASGDVTLTQFAQIDHPIAQDPSATAAPFDDQLATLANNLVTLTASAARTDTRLDSTHRSQTDDVGCNIHFADDGPTIAV